MPRSSPSCHFVPLLGGALAVHWAPALAAVSPPAAHVLQVARCLPRGHGVALTFDDGPHARGTPAVLEILARAGVCATFFLVGEQVLRRPDVAAEIAAAGHEVALHCHRHRNLMRLTPWQAGEDLRRAVQVIGEATGRGPALYRPPYGLLTAPVLALARRQGWHTLLWSREGRDWRARATPASITARLTARAGPGDVLLLHDADDYSARDSWRRTVAALPRILDELARRGLEPTIPRPPGREPAPTD